MLTLPTIPPPVLSDTTLSGDESLERGLPAEEVHRRACAARKVLARAQRALCFWLVEIEQRQLFRHFGCSSAFHYAELYLELAPHTIAEYLRTGKAMEHLPVLAAACERGDISPSKMREISRVAVPETEEAWLDLACSSTYRQIEHLVPLVPKGGLPPGQKTSSEVPAPASTPSPVPDPFCPSWNQGFPGEPPTGQDSAVAEPGEPVGPARYSTRLTIELDNEQMAVLEQALEKARRQSGEKERGALLEYMARAFLGGENNDAVTDVPYRVTLHYLPEKKTAWVEGVTGPRYVAPGTIAEAMCDAEIVDLGANKIQASGAPDDERQPGPETERCCSKQGSKSKAPRQDQGARLRRTIPPTLRRKVLERDRQCSAPGCRHRRFLSLHHINPVEQGGKNLAHNLAVVCSACHRAIHRDELQVEGEAPGALIWRNRWGVILKGSS